MPGRRAQPGRGRTRLRLLDACLAELEEAHARDERLLSPELAARLCAHVPALRPGVPIAEAIDTVFVEQEKCLARGSPKSHATDVRNGASQSELAGPATTAAVPTTAEYWEATIDEAGARTLTDMIRAATQQVCILLLEAHDLRAWSVLGYSTWAEYVRQEFSLSRSRSYELLDQGRVIRELQAATGLTGIPDVSAYAALQIKPHLPHIVEVIRQRAKELGDQDPLEIVTEVVRTERMRIVSARQSQQLKDATTATVLTGDDLTTLHNVLHHLATMPPVCEAIARLPEDAVEKLPDLAGALQWLNEFASALRE